MKAPPKEPYKKAYRIFLRQGGILRTGQAREAGIHAETLYAMRDAGMIERLGWGLYRLTDLSPLSQPDLVTISLRIPNGVICLLSALSFHGMTDQIPHEVSVALPRGSKRPRIDYPPVKVLWFAPEIFDQGIETHQIDGTPVRVYGIERTLADCFKYRNKIGKDTVLEALRRYRQSRKIHFGELMQYARVCRVERVIRPYLEAML